MKNFPDSVQSLLIAEGIQPSEPKIPDGLYIGRYGWRLSQAQGATADFSAGQLIDFTASASAATRIGGGALTAIAGTGATPQVMAWARSVQVIVASTVAITEAHLQDLRDSLYIGWEPNGVKQRRYALTTSVGTAYNGVSSSDSTADTATLRFAAPPTPMGLPGLQVDVEYDQFGLYAADTVSLLANSTETITVIFDGALYVKSGDIPRLVTGGDCGGSGAQRQAIIDRRNLRRLPSLAPSQVG